MKKVTFTTAIWTFLIAIPFTALAVVASAYISDHLIQISTSLGLMMRRFFVQGRDMILEAEISGMVAGLLLLLAIMFATYLLNKRDQEAHQTNR